MLVVLVPSQKNTISIKEIIVLVPSQKNTVSIKEVSCTSSLLEKYGEYSRNAILHKISYTFKEMLAVCETKSQHSSRK